MRFRFLTGDVDLKDYGGKWYAKDTDTDYFIIELINAEDAIGESYAKEHGKYIVILSYVSLEWEDYLKGGLSACGWEDREDLTDLLKVEAIHTYSGGDEIVTLYGNNYRELLKQARRY